MRRRERDYGIEFVGIIIGYSWEYACYNTTHGVPDNDDGRGGIVKRQDISNRVICELGLG